MKKFHLVLAVLLAALAGCLGALAADRWSNNDAEGSLHQFVHDELSLTADQEQRLDALATCLRDRGGDGLHAVCKHGDAYRTVSSSLLVLPWDRAVAATWRYAEGPPDVTAFRDYGDLSAQL